MFIHFYLNCLNEQFLDNNQFAHSISMSLETRDQTRVSLSLSLQEAGKRETLGTRLRSWLIKSRDHEQLADLIGWKDLPNFTLEFGWQLSVSNIDYFKWTKIQSQDVCDARSQDL